MLWRRCSNVVATSTSAQLSFSTVPQRCDNVNNDVVTTFSQRRCASCPWTQDVHWRYTRRPIYVLCSEGNLSVVTFLSFIVSLCNFVIKKLCFFGIEFVLIWESGSFLCGKKISWYLFFWWKAVKCLFQISSSKP